MRACEALGLNVFYDQDNTIAFWGRNFISGMRSIYDGTLARYVVPFLSNEYLAGAYPMDEFTTAMTRAIDVGGDSYILPVLVGDVVVPAEMLNPAIGFLRLEDYSVDGLAQIIAARVGVPHGGQAEPRQIADGGGGAFRVRLPRVPAIDFSPHESLEMALAEVGARFQRAADKLIPFGVRCLVRLSDAALDVRVERQGSPLCGLRLRFDDSFGVDRLTMSFAWPRVSGNAVNGWVTAEWDRDVGEPRLRFFDFVKQEALVTAAELFDLLWAKIIDHVEAQ